MSKMALSFVKTHREEVTALEEIIRKILEAEKLAKDIVAEAENKANHFDEDVKKEIEALTAAYKEDARKKIDRIRATESLTLNDSLARLQQEYESSLQTLRKIYEQNREQWISQMYNEIIGR